MNPFAFAGAAGGLKRGLEDQESRERERRQDGREDATDRRNTERDERDKITHDQNVLLTNIKIPEAEAKASHDEFLREYDEGMGRFIASDGEDTQSLEGLYNDHYPDGENVKIARDPVSKKFTLDFGKGRAAKDLDFEEVVGIGSSMKDPASYMEHMAKSRERKQKFDDDIAKEERQGTRKLKELEVGHGYRMTEKGTPGAVAPKIEIADDGKPYSLSPTGVQAIPGAASGLTFRGADKGRNSAMIQEIDAVAARLPKAQDEDENAHWMRAASERAKLIGKTNPDQGVAEYEKALTAKLLDPSMVNPNKPEKLEEAQSAI